MDFKLAKEIYSSAWHVDPLTLQSYTRLLEDFRNGLQLDPNAAKANSFGIVDAAKAFDAPQLARMEDIPENSIAVYNFDSVITKNGGYSHYGTVQIAQQMKKMEANENVIGHIFFVESGGGSANAIKYIREVSSVASRTKPLVTFAEDMMASAAMYIASDSDWIIANSKDAMIGSIGTMIQFDGYKANTEDATGKRHLRIYATQSVNKNKDFEEAVNNFNFEVIRKSILDPHAAEFIKDMETNRPNITEEQKTGAIYNAAQVVGTLIDEIGTFQMAVDKVKELSNINKSSNNLKINQMDLNKLKAEHPELYNEVLNAGHESGVKAEKDRTATWMVFNDVNPEAVSKGIESGVSMTKAEELTFLRAAQGLEAQKGIEDASQADLSPDKKTAKVTSKTEDENLEAVLANHLNLEEDK